VKDWAVIFDVDGVLLDLTSAEEELFFQPFASRLDATQLSRDWNSYRIRNDEDIVREIVAQHSLAPLEAVKIADEYLRLLEAALAEGQLRSEPIAGAKELLRLFAPQVRLGIATANFKRAAELRLGQVGLWQAVTGLAFGADGGGHKTDILARAIAATALPPRQIIFIGDNVSDVKAGLNNNVHFIGFSQDATRRRNLAAAGARAVAADHDETRVIISSILGA